MGGLFDVSRIGQLLTHTCYIQVPHRVILTPAILSEKFTLLILEVADGTAGSLLAFFEHSPMSCHRGTGMRALKFRRLSLRFYFEQ
jgi:hypothetical protein